MVFSVAVRVSGYTVVSMLAFQEPVPIMVVQAPSVVAFIWYSTNLTLEPPGPGSPALPLMLIIPLFQPLKAAGVTVGTVVSIKTLRCTVSVFPATSVATMVKV